mmetsp:Transcript_47924/g.83949  ORF Transcript_47924/g.83949 Transcript_47924/m.83949 type:complete len:256 (+) Transcript_47924:381-1148(+)
MALGEFPVSRVVGAVGPHKHASPAASVVLPLAAVFATVLKGVIAFAVPTSLAPVPAVPVAVAESIRAETVHVSFQPIAGVDDLPVASHEQPFAVLFAHHPGSLVHQAVAVDTHALAVPQAVVPPAFVDLARIAVHKGLPVVRVRIVVIRIPVAHECIRPGSSDRGDQGSGCLRLGILFTRTAPSTFAALAGGFPRRVGISEVLIELAGVLQGIATDTAFPFTQRVHIEIFEVMATRRQALSGGRWHHWRSSTSQR